MAAADPPSSPGRELPPSLVFAVRLAAITLAGDVLVGGAADTFSKDDPVVVRALTEASLVAFGAIDFLITALFLAAAACAILPRRLLPPWAGWTGWVLAAANFAAVPAIYQGNDFLETVIAGGDAASGSYSYISSIAGLAHIAWLLAAGIAILTAGHKPSAQARQD